MQIPGQMTRVRANSGDRQERQAVRQEAVRGRQGLCFVTPNLHDPERVACNAIPTDIVLANDKDRVLTSTTAARPHSPVHTRSSAPNAHSHAPAPAAGPLRTSRRAASSPIKTGSFIFMVLLIIIIIVAVHHSALSGQVAPQTVLLRSCLEGCGTIHKNQLQFAV